MRLLVSSKTCDAIVDTFIQLSCRGLAYFLPIDREKLLNNLKKDFMVKRELYTIAGGLYLRYGSYMAAASAALLTLNNLKLEDTKTWKRTWKRLNKNFLRTWKRTFLGTWKRTWEKNFSRKIILFEKSQ